jgi:hypothetical protein
LGRRPGSLGASDILQLQRSIGNTAVLRLLDGAGMARAATIQRHRNIPESAIPVQTHGNCGLFSIIAAMKSFGFESEQLTELQKKMDEFVATSEETFVGEIFTVDLMVRIVQGIKFDGKSVLDAIERPFTSPSELEKLLEEYRDDEDVALLIGYSKPDEYDNYYKLRGNYIKHGGKDATETQVDDALDDSIGVKFKAKDAHWGMINQLQEGGLINIADTITEKEPDSKHGYNTLIGLHSLFESNQALASAPFDWSNYLDTKNQQVDYNKMDSSATTKDLKGNKRFEGVRKAKNTESMDLTGRLVVVSVTKHGKRYLPK